MAFFKSNQSTNSLSHTISLDCTLSSSVWVSFSSFLLCLHILKRFTVKNYYLYKSHLVFDCPKSSSPSLTIFLRLPFLSFLYLFFFLFLKRFTVNVPQAFTQYPNDFCTVLIYCLTSLRFAWHLQL